MNIYYLIGNELFMDNYLLRKRLGLNKSELQYIMNRYSFNQEETMMIQNKKLYRYAAVLEYIKMIVSYNDKE